LNRIRVSKIAEVWEKVYLYEAAVEKIMEIVNIEPRKPESEPTTHVTMKIPPEKDLLKTYEQNEKSHDELLELLNKNRFWLGEDNYSEIKKYADTTYDYYLVVKSGQVTDVLKENRRQARAELIKIREKMLKEDY
jgi:hypothetical protein